MIFWRLKKLRSYLPDYLLPIDESIPEYFFLPAQQNASYPFSHSILIRPNPESNLAFMIDSGIGHITIKRILRDFDVSKTFLSHWHEDHISGNYLLQKHGSKFFCHSKDSKILQNLCQIQELYCTKGTMIEEIFKELIRSLKLVDLPQISPLIPDELIPSNDSIKLQVIHTPGHSAGHCCFYDSKNQFIFLGDIDLTGLGPWYGCLDSNLIDFEKSLQKILKLNIVLAVSSHKGIYQGRKKIKEELKRYIEVISKRDEKIKKHLSPSKPTRLTDLVGKNIIYKKYSYMRDYLFIAEQIMIKQHLDRLINQELIWEQGGKFFLTQ